MSRIAVAACVRITQQSPSPKKPRSASALLPAELSRNDSSVCPRIWTRVGIAGVTTETIQVAGVRCERCVMRLGEALQGHDGLEAANANLIGEVTLTWDEVAHVARRPRRGAVAGQGSLRAEV